MGGESVNGEDAAVALQVIVLVSRYFIDVIINSQVLRVMRITMAAISNPFRIAICAIPIETTVRFASYHIQVELLSDARWKPGGDFAQGQPESVLQASTSGCWHIISLSLSSEMRTKGIQGAKPPPCNRPDLSIA
jgi:hypothetical protein